MGRNNVGQLGDGTFYNTKWLPFPIDVDTKFMSITTGRFHSVAIDESGNLWTWVVIVMGRLVLVKTPTLVCRYKLHQILSLLLFQQVMVIHLQ